MYIFHNGFLITEEKIVTGYAVVTKEDKIHDIISEKEMDRYPEAIRLNAKGGYISPGFVDIHSDYIESIVSPRPTSLMNVDTSLRESEKILIGNGITTMFHSLSFYREDVFTHKPMRFPQNVQKLVDCIYASSFKSHLIRHRLHARFEIDNLEEVDRLKENIKAGKIHLLSFMDHTPGQGQYRDLEIFKETLRGYQSFTPEQINQIISERQNATLMTLDHMKEVAQFAKEHGIAVASHDDDQVDKIDLVRSIGTTISEFPITLEVANKAKEKGLHTVVGAPNIMLGGSHSGNLSASKAIMFDLANILCSDYYPSSLLHAIFIMHELYNIDLHQMFQMTTLNPAKAVNMDNEVGSIKRGKKADILIIEKIEAHYPTITLAMVNGSIVNQISYINKAFVKEVR